MPSQEANRNESYCSPFDFISAGLPVLSHVLTPRTKATEVSVL